MKIYIDRHIVSLTILGVVTLLSCFAVLQTQAFNEDRGILKWNPNWLNSGNRYSDSEPVSFYAGMSRGWLPKRLGERSSSLYGGSHQIYKWSPVYFSDRGLFGRSGGYENRRLNIISNDGFDSDDK